MKDSVQYSGTIYEPTYRTLVEWNPQGWNEGYVLIYRKKDSSQQMVFGFDCFCPEGEKALLTIKRWDNGLTFVHVPFHVNKALLEEYTAVERLVIKLIIDFIYSICYSHDSPRCVQLTAEEITQFENVCKWTQNLSFE